MAGDTNEMTEMEVLPLHKHKNLTDACAEILNTFWPRSKAARNHSLGQSCDQFPVCLAFVRRDGNKTEVLGFSKISAVQGIENASLVESVILRDADRGKGLGRVLMNLTEDYAKTQGVKTMYLNTFDQEGFYTRIGYTRCKPVISLGANANRVPKEMLQKLIGTSISPEDTTCNNQSKSNHAGNNVSESSKENGKESKPSTLPVLTSQSPLVPPPPPPPPPPLASTQSISTAKSKSYSRQVIKMDPNSLTWMKKDL